MRLTAKSEYGLLAMIDLAVAEGGKPVSSRAIAEGRGIPQPYLEQLFAALRRAGLVTAVRGAHGGFVLAQPAQETTVLQVVEALEGQPLTSGVCAAADASLVETTATPAKSSEADSTAEGCGCGCGDGASCVAAPVWTRATEVLRELFGGMNLEQLADEQRALENDTSGKGSHE